MSMSLQKLEINFIVLQVLVMRTRDNMTSELFTISRYLIGTQYVSLVSVCLLDDRSIYAEERV